MAKLFGACQAEELLDDASAATQLLLHWKPGAAMGLCRPSALSEDVVADLDEHLAEFLHEVASRGSRWVPSAQVNAPLLLWAVMSASTVQASRPPSRTRLFIPERWPLQAIEALVSLVRVGVSGGFVVDPEPLAAFPPTLQLPDGGIPDAILLASAEDAADFLEALRVWVSRGFGLLRLVLHIHAKHDASGNLLSIKYVGETEAALAPAGSKRPKRRPLAFLPGLLVKGVPTHGGASCLALPGLQLQSCTCAHVSFAEAVAASASLVRDPLAVMLAVHPSSSQWSLSGTAPGALRCADGFTVRSVGPVITTLAVNDASGALPRIVAGVWWLQSWKQQRPPLLVSPWVVRQAWLVSSLSSMSTKDMAGGAAVRLRQCAEVAANIPLACEAQTDGFATYCAVGLDAASNQVTAEWSLRGGDWRQAFPFAALMPGCPPHNALHYKPPSCKQAPSIACAVDSGGSHMVVAAPVQVLGQWLFGVAVVNLRSGFTETLCGKALQLEPCFCFHGALLDLAARRASVTVHGIHTPSAPPSMHTVHVDLPPPC